jgi:prepilin-type N-terminal cleavage/methylation domain-containing protein
VTSSRTCSGFTLIEVVVALAVGGLVALTAAATAASVPDLAGRADARLTRTLRSVAVRTQLREWLRASYAASDSTFGASFTGVDGPRPGTDALQFPIIDAAETMQGRASILLAIDRGADGRPALVAEIEPEHGTPRQIELVPGAHSLEARYLYVLSGEPRWFLGWGSRVERPVAVRLWIDGEDLDPLLRVPLTVWMRS